MQLDLDDGEAGATGDYHRLVINDFDEDVRAEAEHTRFARIRGDVSTHANRDSWVEGNRWRDRCERN
jgi:hypothetical protein